MVDHQLVSSVIITPMFQGLLGVKVFLRLTAVPYFLTAILYPF